MPKLVPLALALLLAAPAVAEAQRPAVPTLVLTAEAAVRAEPDVADIAAGVVTQAPTAEAALAANSRAMTQAVAALRAAGVAERDIQTSALSVQPQFRYRPEEAPVLTGFQASNRVAARIRDPRSVGRVVDALVRAGANQIDGPHFAIDRPQPLLDQARAEAVRIGRQRADLYAAAAGMKVRRISRIEEAGGMEQPPLPVARMMAMEADGGSQPPVAPGELRLVARVTMSFELE